jgi:ubiquinone/menaquinone biosynthesis C-methylase UbiE
LTRVLTDRAGLLEPPVGIDYSRQMLELASRDQQGDGANKIRLAQGSATGLPLKDELFNFVISDHSFKYLTDQELLESLREARRVMKPGALFLAWEFCPTRSPLLDRWNRYLLELDTPLVRLRSYKELRQLAYDAGFDWVQSANLRPFLLPPIPRVSLIMGKAPDGWQSTVVEGRRVMEPIEIQS